MNGKATTDLNYRLIALSNCNVDAVFNALQQLLNDMQRIIVDEKAEQFGLTGAWRVYGIYQ